MKFTSYVKLKENVPGHTAPAQAQGVKPTNQPAPAAPAPPQQPAKITPAQALQTLIDNFKNNPQAMQALTTLKQTVGIK